jgi:outer membrane protein assembly factor BamB
MRFLNYVLSVLLPLLLISALTGCHKNRGVDTESRNNNSTSSLTVPEIDYTPIPGFNTSRTGQRDIKTNISLSQDSIIIRRRTRTLDAFETQAPVLIENKYLYTIGKGNVYSINRSNGNLTWSTKIEGLIEPPAISQNSIYVGVSYIETEPPYSSSGAIISMDKQTGEKKWSHQIKEDPEYSPVTKNENVFFSSDDVIYKLDTEGNVE